MCAATSISWIPAPTSTFHRLCLCNVGQRAYFPLLLRRISLLKLLLMLSGLHMSSYRLRAAVVNCPAQSSPGAHLFLTQPIAAFRRPRHLATRLATRSPSPPRLLPARVGGVAPGGSRSLLSSGSSLRIFQLSSEFWGDFENLCEGPGSFLISVIKSSISIRVNESSHHKQQPNPLETSISCLPFCSTACGWKEFRLWQTGVNIPCLIGEILRTAYTVSSSFLLHHSSISPHYSSTRHADIIYRPVICCPGLLRAGHS